MGGTARWEEEGAGRLVKVEVGREDVGVLVRVEVGVLLRVEVGVFVVVGRLAERERVFVTA